ncbi:MAG: hypothetical protein PSV22_11950 [Pseudolabrys sp.]|nr:hypothetical protein [Pseudolabrys sp.]
MARNNPDAARTGSIGVAVFFEINRRVFVGDFDRRKRRDGLGLRRRPFDFQQDFNRPIVRAEDGEARALAKFIREFFSALGFKQFGLGGGDQRRTVGVADSVCVVRFFQDFLFQSGGDGIEVRPNLEIEGIIDHRQIARHFGCLRPSFRKLDLRIRVQLEFAPVVHLESLLKSQRHRLALFGASAKAGFPA